MPDQFSEIITKAEHYKAIGKTKIYLHDDDPSLPWDRVSSVHTGCSYRFNGPASMRVAAEISGLMFEWDVDFEGRDANGCGVSLFDRDRLRDVAMRLPVSIRKQFADLFRNAVLPDLEKRTNEMRLALNKQLDSEDCVRGLIAFAEREAA